MSLAKTKFLASSLLIILFTLSFFVSDALAQRSSESESTRTGRSVWELPNPLDTDSFEGLVSSIAEWLYMIMIPISAIIFLYAGAMFMFSGGDEEKIKKAKRALFWALVGVGIIIIGRGIVETINSFLGTNPSNTSPSGLPYY